MTVADDVFAPTHATAAPRRRLPAYIWLPAMMAVAMVLISTARVVTGAHELDSTGTLKEAINAIVPIAVAGLAGLWSERAGIVNIGLEGMMILGTIGGGYFGFWYGPWAGVLGAIAFGAIGGLLHAIATVLLGVDHIVSGVAITIMAGGIAAYLSETWFAGLEGGNETKSPPIDELPTISVDPIASWASGIEDKHWWLISDLASVLGALTEDLSILTVVSALLFVATYFILWRTGFGLRLRSCGENPAAAESLGVSVYRYKMLAVLVSGALSGFAGAFLVNWAGSYTNGMTNERGYLGLAAMIFGNWRPGGLLVGSGLFGYTDALQLRAGGAAVHALLLVIGIVLIAYAVSQFRGGRRLGAAISGLVAVGALVWFFAADAVPEDFTRMTPYVITLFVLAFAAQRLRMPAADGQVYRKGSAG
jgi:simple sugar transport system permease protein